MKKFFVFGLSLCMLMAFSSCKSKKESAYKTAYDQAKQQELVQGNSQASDPIEIAPVTSNTATKADASYRSEKVVLASGAAGSFLLPICIVLFAVHMMIVSRLPRHAHSSRLTTPMMLISRRRGCFTTTNIY